MKWIPGCKTEKEIKPDALLQEAQAIKIFPKFETHIRARELFSTPDNLYK